MTFNLLKILKGMFTPYVEPGKTTITPEELSSMGCGLPGNHLSSGLNDGNCPECGDFTQGTGVCNKCHGEIQATALKETQPIAKKTDRLPSTIYRMCLNCGSGNTNKIICHKCGCHPGLIQGTPKLQNRTKSPRRHSVKRGKRMVIDKSHTSYGHDDGGSSCGSSSSGSSDSGGGCGGGGE